MSSPPTRVAEDLYAAAKSAGAATSRSAAQQITYWARIGREFEASPAVSHRDIERALAGSGSYDALSERAQAIARAVWAERMANRRDSLDFETEFTTSGEAWSEADEDGRLILKGVRHS